jgi:hypothetical protein
VSDDLWWDGIIPPTKPRPNEKLWEFLKGHDIYSCELKYRGEYGVEVQLFKNGEFFVGHLRNTRAGREVGGGRTEVYREGTAASR